MLRSGGGGVGLLLGGFGCCRGGGTRLGLLGRMTCWVLVALCSFRFAAEC